MKPLFVERRVAAAQARSLMGLLFACIAWVGGLGAASPPNLIVIFSDDVGYGDLACYGSDKVPSPHIDRLAAEGMRFTDFHVPANVCGPSRVALLTGRHPMRAGHPVARADFPKYMQYGIAPDEITLAEVLKPAGYRSLLVGKWHLGFHVIGSHPLDAGFDEHLGVPSNYAPKVLHHDTLYRGKTVDEQEVPFEDLTTRYTDEVVQFLGREHDAPFFIFMSHHIAHTPIRPSTTFKGSTGHGAYVDFLSELDHSTGRIMQALEDNGLDENTLVVFTSDNGPTPTGDPGGLNGGKYVTMEGGHRVPGIVRWPGVIPSGVVSDTTVTSMDLFPLFCDLAGVELPSDRKIDGRNIRSILQGKTTESPHETIAYYNGTNLQAVRQGAWKLHLPRTIDDQPFWNKRAGGNPMKVYLTLEEPLLFNLTEDVGERVNLAARYPGVVKSLLNVAKQVRAELGDVHMRGTDQRPTGLDEPQERPPEQPVQSGPLG